MTGTRSLWGTLMMALALLIFGSWSWCPPAYSQSVVQRTVVTVPYSTDDFWEFAGTGSGIPIISVLVNGHPADFVFDTGTPDILISQAFARRAGLFAARSARAAPPSAPASPRVSPTEPASVQAGSLTFPESAVIIQDFDLSNLVHRHIDGILGVRAIDHAALLYSPTRRTLTFFGGGNLTQRERDEIGMGRAMAVPLKLTEEQLLSAVITLRQNAVTVSEDLVIDTGAKDTVISEGLFHELNGRIVSKGTLETVWGNEDETSFVVEEAEIGSAVVKRPVVNYSANHRFQLPLVLGRNILSRYQVLIDPPAMMMYLLPAHDAFPAQQGEIDAVSLDGGEQFR